MSSLYEIRNQASELCYAIEQKLSASKEVTDILIQASKLRQTAQDAYDVLLRLQEKPHVFTLEEIKDNAWNIASGVLNLLRNKAHNTAVDHGFTNATIGEEIALMHSELSEALEDHRDGKPVNEVQYYENDTNSYKLISRIDGKILKPTGIPSEMADVIIRIFDFCGKHSIDIGKAVIEKMEYNDSRPFRHGGKKL